MGIHKFDQGGTIRWILFAPLVRRQCLCLSFRFLIPILTFSFCFEFDGIVGVMNEYNVHLRVFSLERTLCLCDTFDAIQNPTLKTTECLPFS